MTIPHQPSTNYRRYKRPCLRRCKDGGSCQFPALKSSPYCFSHDPSPEGKARRKAAQQRGGRNKRKFVTSLCDPGKPLTMEEVNGLILRVTHDLGCGRIDRPTANVMLFGCLLAVRGVGASPPVDTASHRLLLSPQQVAEALGELIRLAERTRLRLKVLPMLQRLSAAVALKRAL